jgi:hypothetical protein
MAQRISASPTDLSTLLGDQTNSEELERMRAERRTSSFERLGGRSGSGISKLGLAIGIRIGERFRNRGAQETEEQKARAVTESEKIFNTARAKNLEADPTDIFGAQKSAMLEAILHLRKLGSPLAGELTQQLGEMVKVEEQRKFDLDQVNAFSEADLRSKQAGAEQSEQKVFENAEDAAQFLFDPKSGNLIGQGNTNTAASRAEWETLKSANPGAVPLNREQYAQMFMSDHALEQRATLASVTEEAERNKPDVVQRGWYKKVLPNIELAGALTEYKRMLVDNPSISTVGEQAKGWVSNIANHTRSLMQIKGNDKESAEIFDALIEDHIGPKPMFGKAAEDWARRRSLVEEISYAIAIEREGGRLTNQDIERASKTIGRDVADPRIVIKIIDNIIDRKRTAMTEGAFSLSIDKMEVGRRALEGLHRVWDDYDSVVLPEEGEGRTQNPGAPSVSIGTPTLIQ